MNRAGLIGSLVLTAAAFFGTMSVWATPGRQAADADRALGKWHSIEQFEGEPRIAVSFRRGDRSIEGWALLLGQHRKGDDRATLRLSFTDATWTGQSIRFSTILPEDEGTIGWELRVVTPTTAVLTALTENGRPIQDELMWEMVR
jgi:hypothetical protein